MIKVLVIGEVCEDVFVYGKCQRLSPEAPVPVMTPITTVINSGMSGNVVRNLLALDSGIFVNHCHQIEKISKTRYVDKKSNHMFLRLDEGETYITGLSFTDEKLQNINGYDFLIVSDYNKGFLSEDLLAFLGNSAKLSVLDSKRKLNKKVVDSFTFVKLNEKEYENNSDVHSSKNIIVTLGENGVKYNGKIFKSPNPQETIDVSGAGDTFTASFILEYFRTKDIEKSLVFANNKSATVVSKRGVATP